MYAIINNEKQQWLQNIACVVSAFVRVHEQTFKANKTPLNNTTAEFSFYLSFSPMPWENVHPRYPL